MRDRPVYDVVALLARCAVGVVFLVHGWQKIQVGMTATSRSFGALGVPAPTAAAVYATFAELLGGAALILGLALPVAGALLFLDMAGAFSFVNARHGLLLVDQGRVKNGFELVLVLGLAALLFAAGGGGRLTLDRHLFGPRGRGPRHPGGPEPPPGRRDGGPVTGRDADAPAPLGSGGAGGPGGTGTAAPGDRAATTGRASGEAAGGSPGRRSGDDGPGAADTPAGDVEDDTADGSFDDLAARTGSVRHPRTGRGTAGTSRDVPVAGMKRPSAADDGPTGTTRRKGRPGKTA